jgi:hypothetical protein
MPYFKRTAGRDEGAAAPGLPRLMAADAIASAFAGTDSIVAVASAILAEESGFDSKWIIAAPGEVPSRSISSMLREFGAPLDCGRGAGPGQEAIASFEVQLAPRSPRVKVMLEVSNDAEESLEVSLLCVGLVSPSGGSIGRENVSFDPPRATVPADGRMEIAMDIGVPPDTPSGAYSGLIVSRGANGLKALINLEVI